MRIDCQSCGAAYAIDDSLIGDRGVRAQCPRCGAQKVVKKAEAAAAASAAPFGAPPAPNDPFGQTSAAPNPFAGGAGAGSPFGGGNASPFGPPPAAPPTPGFGAPQAASPFGGAPPFGGAAPPSPFGAPAASSPFGNPPPAPASPFGAPPANPFASTQAPGLSQPQSPFGGAPPPPSPFGGPANPPANPFGGAPAGGSPFGGAPPAAANPFDATSGVGGGRPPPPGAPNPFAAPPAPAASPMEQLGMQKGGGDPFAGMGPPAGPQDAPFGGAPSAADAPAEERKRSSPALPAAAGGGSPFSFLPPSGAGPAPAAGDDPFANLGGDAPAAPAPGPTGEKDPREWKVRLADGTTLGPLTLDEVRQRVKSGEITKEAQASQGQGQFRAITGFAPLAVVFRSPGDKGQGQRVVYRKQDSGGAPWMLIVAAVLLLGGGGAIFAFKDKLFGPKEMEIENIFARRAQVWRLQFPDLDGTSEEHLARGLKYHKEDSALGYRLADEELLKALCLDPENMEAIGAYVENYALLPPRRNDMETTKDALDGIEYALKKNPRRARLQRAHGALLLKMGRVELAQGALAQAMRMDPQDAAAKLWMAQSNLDRNVAESIKLTEDAMRADPELARASYVLGMAYQKQGRFKTALDRFRARLAKDKEHRETLLAIARLFVEVGDFAQAQQHLERLLQVDAKNIVARLMLAKVHYQGLRDFRRAEGQLQELVSIMGSEGAEMAREVYTHQAFVLGERGRWKEAEEAVNAALKDDPAYGPALYVAGRVLLHRGAAAEAREKLERAAQQVANTYLEAPVRTALADVFRAQGQTSEAVKAYTAVIRNDARYVRAYLGLSSLYAEANNMQQAAHMMREVLDIDPFHRTDHFYFTDYPETPRDTEVYRPAWGKVKPGENDKSIVLSSEGITAFHAEQYDEAETLLRRALADDRNNLAGHMYLGATQLVRKRGKDAVTHLQQANRINNLHTRTNYLLGRALAAAGENEKAEKKFSEVREADANFVAALNAIGEMSLKRGEDEKARDAFLDAFKADADFTPAKANLLKTGY